MDGMAAESLLSSLSPAANSFHGHKDVFMEEVKIRYRSYSGVKPALPAPRADSHIHPSPQVIPPFYSNQANLNHHQPVTSSSFMDAHSIYSPSVLSDPIFSEADSSSNQQQSETHQNYQQPGPSHSFHRQISAYGSFKCGSTSTQSVPVVDGGYGQHNPVSSHSAADSDAEIRGMVIEIVKEDNARSQQLTNAQKMLAPMSNYATLTNAGQQYQANTARRQPPVFDPSPAANASYEMQNYQLMEREGAGTGHAPYPASLDGPNPTLPNPLPAELQRELMGERATARKHRRGHGQKVKEEYKDETYWERRKRNNLAAKRSRDHKRQNENQTSAAARDLEKKNDELRGHIAELKVTVAALKNIYQSSPKYYEKYNPNIN